MPRRGEGAHDVAWVEPGTLAISARPSPSQVRRLKEMGVRGLVSLTEEASDIGEEAARWGLRWLHVPVPDFQAPTLSQLEEALAFIHEVSGDGPVVVHCGAGRGRSGTVAACYLVSRGHPPARALALVRRCRPGAVETQAQEEVVYQYAALRAHGG